MRVHTLCVMAARWGVDQSSCCERLCCIRVVGGLVIGRGRAWQGTGWQKSVPVSGMIHEFGSFGQHLSSYYCAALFAAALCERWGGVL